MQEIKLKKNWGMKMMTKMTIKGTDYAMSECETCVHKKICKIKEQYKKLNDKVTKLDFNTLDDSSNFLIYTECKNYLHERYLKSFT